MSEPYVPSHTPLGQQNATACSYSPELLCAIPRDRTRAQLGLSATSTLPFRGVDIWNAYELSWLDERGKPVVATGTFTVPCDSPNIVESKSFKLYLNSINQTRMASLDHVRSTFEQDLSRVVGAPVGVELGALQEAGFTGSGEAPGILLDNMTLEIDCYQPNPDFLILDDPLGDEISETLCSHLLRSCCPVTAQPDWGSVFIRYCGEAINKEGLLRYIVSFRGNQEFHEQCVERMFIDILQRCQPKELSVYARYLRRGGLDINPFRSSGLEIPENQRLYRQ